MSKSNRVTYTTLLNMSIIICPGIHEPSLTESFVLSLRKQVCQNSSTVTSDDMLIFPKQGFFPLSGIHILQFLYQRLGNWKAQPVLFISFSAGVVGAIVAACKWQMLGGQISAFIAIDGWGVPLWGNFPIHRMSHDYFTHWSSSFLGEGQNNFYADPPVDHLEMWRSPQNVQGWCRELSGDRLTAAEFLHILVDQYN
jgi:hypothetical protein